MPELEIIQFELPIFLPMDLGNKLFNFGPKYNKNNVAK